METQVMTKYITRALVLISAVVAAGCTMSDSNPPPPAGPSEMSLSLAITASPDVLSLDGASQTLVTIEARDHNGQVAPNVPLRIEILADNQIIDFGSISARTLVTNSNGRATFTYTAPAFVSGPIPDVELGVTPTGSDASGHIRRVVSVRLVPPGVIAGAPNAAFTFTPTNPAAFTSVRFDASESTGGLGAVITSYVWDFGDNSSGTGRTATHQYSLPGTYVARLTVTDSNGISSQSAGQTVTVGAGSGPTAAFVYSPTNPVVNESIFFNGRTSTAGQGHQIVRYDWSFGTGAGRSGSTVTRSYAAPGTYNVVLTVTDEVGQTDQITQTVTVAPTGQPVAAFTVSPTDPAPGDVVRFDGSSSTAPAGSTITSYTWDFGNGLTATGVRASTTYSSANTFTVRLTVRDSAGRTTTTTETLSVAAAGSTAGPTSSFTVSATPTAGAPVTFNGSGSTPSSSIVSYTWDFGDLTSGSGTIVSHTYLTAGTRTVRLTVVDNAGLSGTSTQSVVVAP